MNALSLSLSLPHTFFLFFSPPLVSSLLRIIHLINSVQPPRSKKKKKIQPTNQKLSSHSHLSELSLSLSFFGPFFFFSKLSHDDGIYSVKERRRFFFFPATKQQKNQETLWSTCLANDDDGEAPPLAHPPKRNQSNYCCGTVRPFQLSSQESRRWDERTTGWSYHLVNHVGTLP